MPLGKLTCGCVLHVAGFSSRGHTPRNKYILILGQVNDYTALGFLISSQLAYLGQDSHRVEVVRIPQGATGFLRYESIIQCFELEQLSIPDLSDGFDNGRVAVVGRIQTRYLHRIREAVTNSRLPTQRDIDAALSLLPEETA